jgi:hypothetical protein
MKWHEEIGGGGCDGGSCVRFEDGGVGHLDQMKMLVMVVMEGNHRGFHSHSIVAQLMGCLRPMAEVQAFLMFLLCSKYPCIFDMLLPFS